MAYSTTLGRWVEMDPIGYPDGLNGYQYLLSNPLNGVDWTGLQQQINQTPTDARFKQHFTQEEGRRDKIYPDPKGLDTVGIGHRVFPNDPVLKQCGIDQAKLVAGGKLTPEEIDKLFAADLKRMQNRAWLDFPNYDELPPDVQLALLDATFNIGSMNDFGQLKDAIRKRDFCQAAWDLGHKNRNPTSPPSKYTSDVPNRAKRNLDRLNKAGDDESLKDLGVDPDSMSAANKRFIFAGIGPSHNIRD